MGKHVQCHLKNGLQQQMQLNYRAHTDAIKNNLIPPELTARQISYTYASEADLLNVVLFGKTAGRTHETAS